MAKEMIDNRQKSIYNACIILTMITAISAIYNIKFFQDDINGVLALLSILISISSFVCIFIFKKRSDAIKKANRDKQYVASWSFNKKKWQGFLDLELKERLRENKDRFIFISIISIIIFGLFILFIPEGKLAMAISLAMLLLILAIAAFCFPRIGYMLQKKEGSILILNKGIAVNKTFHSWDFPLSRLEQVRLKNDVLEITYGFFDRLGPRSYTVRVPYPNKLEAERVKKDLEKSNPKKKRKKRI